MYYNLLVKGSYALIRPACDGLSDVEFEAGIRMIMQASSKLPLHLSIAERDLEECFTSEEFHELCNMEDIEVIKTPQRRESFVSTEKYNRGPYSKYTRG